MPTTSVAAGVHTGSLDRALRAIRGIEAGSVWVNRYGRSNDFVIPTGGFKGSGIGKDLGLEAYKANLRYKSALIDFEQDAGWTTSPATRRDTARQDDANLAIE